MPCLRVPAPRRSAATMITWLLIAIITLTIVIAYKGHGPFTFVMAGLCVFLIYSIPALLQLKTLFSYESKDFRYLADAGQQSGYVVFTAWAAVAVTLLIAAATRKGGRRLKLSSAELESGPYWNA